MSTNSIVVNKTFEEKMKERIRESIGDLMPDEMLTKIIEKSIDEEFFKCKEVKDNYGRTISSNPPVIRDIIKELLGESVRRKVGEYINNHNEEISKLVCQVIQQGMSNALLNGINNFFQNELFSLQNSINERLNNERLNNPYIGNPYNHS